MPDWVRRSITAHPDRPALTDGQTMMTYADLGAAIDHVGTSLRDRGVRRGDRVIVDAERGLTQAVTMLAILDLRAAVAVVDLQRRTQWADHAIAKINPKLVLTTDAGEPTSTPGDAHGSPSPGDAAYLLPTSGTTGRPKVVAVPHGALANRVRWAQRCYPLHANDVVLQLSSPAFDFAFWELLAPLCVGAMVAIAPAYSEAEPSELVTFMAATGVTVAHFVPSLLAEYLAGSGGSGLAGLRYLLCGGERLTADLCRRVRAVTQARVLNQYGPTEACIDFLTHEVTATDTDPIPIGRPIDGVTTHVLGPHGERVPDGQPGLLYVGGACLAWGYLGDAARTAEMFVPAADGQRLYNTGDLVRRRPDGVMEILGRADEQVKIRGVRLEPAAVEATLVAHPAVRHAIVLVSGEQLVAHLVLDEDCPDDELRSFLGDRLPPAAVPSQYVRHSTLPKLPNGKVDRMALLGSSVPTETTDDAESVMERRIAHLWAGVLGVPSVGRSADFFTLGGNSLLAMRMVARVRKQFGVRVPVRLIFDAPTLAAYSAHLEQLT
nr:pyoverdine chromophore precursor synthetase [Kibdelosporangium sp. MJ126-NF4]